MSTSVNSFVLFLFAYIIVRSFYTFLFGSGFGLPLVPLDDDHVGDTGEHAHVTSEP